MKHATIWKTTAVLAMAVLAVQCGGDEPKSTAGSGGEGSATASPNGRSSQDPAGTLEDLVRTVQQHRQNPEQVWIVPTPSTEPAVELLAAVDIKGRVLNAPNGGRYFANQLIPKLRTYGRLWLILDTAHAKYTKFIEDTFLAIHTVASTRMFGTFALYEVTNEFAAGEERAKRLQLVEVARGAGGITNVVFAPAGDLMFTTSKAGLVRWYSTTDERNGDVLQLPRSDSGGPGLFTGGESGLVGCTTHPEFPTDPRLYTHYNYNKGGGKRVAIISEWTLRVGEDEVVAADERIVLEIPQPRENHNGGPLAFGPDGYLYISVGDGQVGKWTIGRSAADNLRGKILRIDPNSRGGDKQYGIPADNPFVGHATIRPEVFAWGFRNPWRMSFAPDGRLVASEIGEDRNEEVSIVEKGRHHGWPYIEGTYERNPWALGDDEVPVPPMVAYGRDTGMSVIGGYVYEGDDIAWLTGKYVFTDFLSGHVWAMDLPPAGEPVRTVDPADTLHLGRWPQLFTTFGKDPAGDLYLGGQAGKVYRLAAADGSTPTVATDGVSDELDDDVVRGMFQAEFPAPARTDVTEAQIALGKMLYSDPRLSTDGKISCATCHRLDRFGQDGAKLAVAAHGAGTRRNTPSTFNAHRQFAQLWDYRVTTIEEVAAAKLLGEHGFADDAAVAAKLAEIPEAKELFAAAFPGQDAPGTAANAAQALGAFVRQLVTRSRWDDYLDGDADALTVAEKKGLATFVSAGCVTCHQYRALGGNMPQKLGLMTPCVGDDKGRGAIAGDAGQDYYFKVTPLLNVAATGPYYHDGSMATLADAVRHMASVQLNRDLSDAQVDAIVTFLGALTGEKPAILD